MWLRVIQVKLCDITELFVRTMNLFNFKKVLQLNEVKKNRMVLFVSCSTGLVKAASDNFNCTKSLVNGQKQTHQFTLIMVQSVKRRYWCWQWQNSSLFEERLAKIIRFKRCSNRQIWRYIKAYKARYKCCAKEFRWWDCL